jgi:hypothetical protein
MRKENCCRSKSWQLTSLGTWFVKLFDDFEQALAAPECRQEKRRGLTFGRFVMDTRFENGFTIEKLEDRIAPLLGLGGLGASVGVGDIGLATAVNANVLGLISVGAGVELQFGGISLGL